MNLPHLLRLELETSFGKKKKIKSPQLKPHFINNNLEGITLSGIIKNIDGSISHY